MGELSRLLTSAKYDTEKTHKLIQGFTQGFDVGYRGPEVHRHRSQNIPLTIGSPTELWNKVMKEVMLNRYAGPYKLSELPFVHYIQSPIGLVPKGKDKTRLIFHLLFDFGLQEGDKSLNYHTSESLCSVKYNDLDHAVLNCLKLLDMTKMEKKVIYYAKSDVSSAFRVLPILPRQRKFLAMMAKHPETRVEYFFIDMCLPFGASISCALYQEFSNALRAIAEHRLGMLMIMPVMITNYLDDFLFIVLCVALCNGAVHELITICSIINCPLSLEKTEYAESYKVFLGVLMNGKDKVLSIPLEKRNRALELLNYTIDNRKVKIKFIQKLTGTLNFLNRAIVPGRVFTRGMYAK